MARRLIKGGKRREQKRQDVLMQAIERRYTGQIKAEIERAMMADVAAIEDGLPLPPVNQHQRAIADILEPMARQSVLTFGARILMQGEEKGVPFLERKDFADTLAKLALRYIMMEAFRRHITSIAETTRAQIITALVRGQNEGLGVAGIGRFIRDLVPSLSTYRSNLIARTETHGAANYGANAAAVETGLTLQKEWVSAADERTRESHRLADGQIVGMDDAFDVGGSLLMYPGDPSGPADEIINCRCSISHLVTDD